MGGKGQELLLAAPVRVIGLGAAAAYLAAGGTPVLTDTLTGFFAGESAAAFNPDAVSAFPPQGLVAQVPYDFPPQPTRAVAVGADGVVFRNAGCAECFAASAGALTQGPVPVAIEALAALAWQRIALGLADPLGGLTLDGGPAPVRRCEAHR